MPRVVFNPSSGAGRHAFVRSNPWHPTSATRRFVDDADCNRLLVDFDAHEVHGRTPRTPAVGAVEATTARASLLPSRIGQVLVNRQKERPETPSSMQLMPHHGVLLGLKPLKEDTPREASRSITLIEGGYRQNLEQVDQNPRISHRLCWPRSKGTPCERIARRNDRPQPRRQTN